MSKEENYNDYLVVLKTVDGIHSLEEVINDIPLWQEYLKQYDSANDGDLYLNHYEYFKDLGIEHRNTEGDLVFGATPSDNEIAQVLQAAHLYFTQTIFVDGRINRNLIKHRESGKITTSFEPPHYNHHFYIKLFKIKTIWEEEKDDQEAYFRALKKSLNKQKPSPTSSVIRYMFSKNPKALEALKKDTKEYLKETGFDSWSNDGKDVKKLLATTGKDREKALKVVADVKTGLLSMEKTKAGFGTKRLWTEQCILSQKFDKLAKFHKGEFANYYSNASQYFPKKEKTLFVETKNPAAFINQLTHVQGSEIFLNMKNDKYSNLLPKIQLYAVKYREEDGEVLKIPENQEIIFPQNAQVFSGKSILGRGDYGIQSFNWDLIGSNPRTVRNDIQAELVLYFQSLDQIFADADNSQANNNILKLLKRPPKAQRKTKEELEKKKNKSCADLNVPEGKDTKNREYYEVRADVGWMPASNSTGLSTDEKTAIKNQNLSMFLTLIDHSFNFKQDGTFTLALTYRGRVEELLSNQVADAIATPKFKMERQIIKSIKHYISSSSKESSEGEETPKSKSSEFNDLVAKHNKDFKRNAFSDIIDDMSNKNRIFYVKLLTSELIDFVNEGKKVSLEPAGNIHIMSDICGSGEAPTSMTGKFEDMVKTQAEITESEDDEKKSTSAAVNDGFDINNEDYFFSFFFLGDLLDTIFTRACKSENMESVIEEYLNPGGKAWAFLSGQPIKEVEAEIHESLEQNKIFYQQLQSTKLILGCFPITNKECLTTVYNLAQIPISTKLFKDWFATKVVDRDIDVYPLTQFARDVIKDLAIYALKDHCESLTESNLALRTTSLTGRPNIEKLPNFSFNKSRALKGTHAENYLHMEDTVINLNKVEKEEEKVNNVLIIYAEDSSIKNLTGDIDQDEKAGIQHLFYGRDRGIVTSIQFTKNDIPGLREAKFSRDSLNALSELSTVYNANIVTVGNVIFWPGQKAFLNPLGMGSSVGNPTDPKSYASVLGLGGYYTLLDIKSSITAGSYRTTMRAQWETSGLKSSSGYARRGSVQLVDVNINPLAPEEILDLEEEN